MKYSIVIPVFNKAAYTKHCLDSLQSTLGDAGEGETIVVDNGSTDDTQALLSAYPWITVIRNERNLGYAVANNQGAAAATGKYLVLLNNDTQAQGGWLASMLRAAREPNVGVVGAKLLYADGTIQHGGVMLAQMPMGRHGLVALQCADGLEGSIPFAERGELQAVTGACMLTPRALYNELGGLDERFWNGYEDVDYCLRVRERGLRVCLDPGAVLYHFESKSGVERFRRSAWNGEALGERWKGRVKADAFDVMLRNGIVRRAMREARGSVVFRSLPVPHATIVVDGSEPKIGRAAFELQLRAHAIPVEAIIWAGADDAIRVAREAMEHRADKYVACVDSAASLEAGWLDRLAHDVETYANVCASSDEACTLFALRKLPQHLRLETNHERLPAAISDLLDRCLGSRLAFCRANEVIPEERLRRKPVAPKLVSIVTLSWNAVEFTKIALDSIRAHTTVPYEVVVVDNGSDEETLAYLRSIDDPCVRVLYNRRNLGFGGGNNVGLAAARGEYVVILNNDVIVTDGWLEGLLDPFGRIPGLGVTAPRCNRIAGDQIVTDATYADLSGIASYAAERRATWRGHGYLTERAIGFCLCIDRRVIDEVGGFDEKFGLGNFEDDDLCVRIRAARYSIYVCDDVFIHHFGSQSFVANKVDYAASMQTNWRYFASKWGFMYELDPRVGYDPLPASRSGFVREKHYCPLPQSREEGARITFAACVANEKDWQELSGFVRRFGRAFSSEDAATLAIAAIGALDAKNVAERVERTLGRAGVCVDSAANIEISDEDDVERWLQSLERAIRFDTVQDASPAGLRRYLEVRR